LNSINIKSYEAPKVYRDYSITGTDGFKPSETTRKEFQT